MSVDASFSGSIGCVTVVIVVEEVDVNVVVLGGRQSVQTSLMLPLRT